MGAVENKNSNLRTRKQNEMKLQIWNWTDKRAMKRNTIERSREKQQLDKKINVGPRAAGIYWIIKGKCPVDS